MLLDLCSSFLCVFHVLSNTCFNLTCWCEFKGITLIIVAFPSNKFQKPVRTLIPVGCLENELDTHSCSSRCVVCRHFHLCDRFKARSLVRILPRLELVTVPRLSNTYSDKTEYSTNGTLKVNMVLDEFYLIWYKHTYTHDVHYPEFLKQVFRFAFEFLFSNSLHSMTWGPVLRADRISGSRVTWHQAQF